MQDVPDTLSQRKTAWLLGRSRDAITSMIADGLLTTTAMGQITRDSLERHIGRRLTAQDYDAVIVATRRARHG